MASFRLFLLLLGAAHFSSSQAQILFGQLIGLRHVDSGKNILTSATPSTHPGSSLQNQVVGVSFMDTSCRWRVLPAAGVDLKSVLGKIEQKVRDADVIRLQHINTFKLLHSHAGFTSGVSQRQEVTGFNEQEDTDQNDNWILRVLAPLPGQFWTTDVGVRLMHQQTGAKLFSANALSHANYTAGYQEVSSSQQEEEELQQNYEWIAVPISASCAGLTVDSCFSSFNTGETAQESTTSKEGFQKFLALFNAWDEERFKHFNDDPNNTPKEISIYCPVNPNVNIQELDYSLQAQGDCMVLNIQSPHLEAKLSLKCSDKGGKKKKSEEEKPNAEE